MPTANFFQRHGYTDNPVAQHNNVVAKLIAAIDARMDQEVNKPGAKELANEMKALGQTSGPSSLHRNLFSAY